MSVKGIVEEQYPSWDTAGRPNVPVMGQSGWNTELLQFEIWDKDESDWMPAIVSSGGTSWTTGTRPGTPYLGQDGFNTTDSVREYWDGTNWIQY